MPHQPGHVFDPYNLSPEEEKSRRLLRQAEDALAPAAMRGQLGERGPLQEFLIEQADDIKNITGAKRARITDPDAFGSFLAGRSDEFEEFTGRPSPMRQAMLAEEGALSPTGMPERPGERGLSKMEKLELGAFAASPVLMGMAPFFAAEAGAELASEGVERLPSWVPTPVTTGLEGPLAAAAFKRGKITPKSAALGFSAGAGIGDVADKLGFGEQAEQLGAMLSGGLSGDAVTGFGFRAPTLFAGAGRTADPTGVRLPSGRVGDPSATVAAIRNLPRRGEQVADVGQQAARTSNDAALDEWQIRFGAAIRQSDYGFRDRTEANMEEIVALFEEGRRLGLPDDDIVAISAEIVGQLPPGAARQISQVPPAATRVDPAAGTAFDPRDITDIRQIGGLPVSPSRAQLGPEQVQLGREDIVDLSDPRIAVAPYQPDWVLQELAGKTPGSYVQYITESANEVPMLGRVGPTGEIEPDIEMARLFLTSRRPPVGEGSAEALAAGRKVNRGREALIKRIELERNVGGGGWIGERGISNEVADAAITFIRSMPDEVLEGGALSFRNVDSFGPAREGQIVAGFYDTGDSLANIALGTLNRSIDPNRLIIHEVSHHIERFLGNDAFRALQQQYRRELADGGEMQLFREELKSANRKELRDKLLRDAEWSLTPEQFRQYREGRSFPGVRRLPPPYGAAAEVYRFNNFHEWFAEVLTDKTLRDWYKQSLPEEAPRNAFRRAIDLLENFAIGVRNILLRNNRPDAAERVYQDLIAGTVRRVGRQPADQPRRQGVFNLADEAGGAADDVTGGGTPMRPRFGRPYTTEDGLDDFFPRVREGDSVGGRTVGGRIDNQDSISASFGNDFETLPGIRQVSMEGFTRARGTERHERAVRELVTEIEQSGRIDPLIIDIGISGEVSILEGTTRIGALLDLGADSFPAKVVLDTTQGSVDEVIAATRVVEGRLRAGPAATTPVRAADEVAEQISLEGTRVSTPEQEFGRITKANLEQVDPATPEDILPTVARARTITGKAFDAMQDCPPGQCFRNARRVAITEFPEGRVIHGVVTGTGTDGVSSKRIAHAWIEIGDEVIDPTAGIRVAKKQYYSQLQAVPEQTFSPDQAMVNALRTQNEGPWTPAEIGDRQIANVPSPATPPVRAADEAVPPVTQAAAPPPPAPGTAAQRKALEAEIKQLRRQQSFSGGLKLSNQLERQVALESLEKRLRAKEPTDAAVVALARQLREAGPLSPEQIRVLRSAELKRRVGAGANILERGQGPEAFARARGPLVGPLPDPKFQPPTMTTEDVFLLSERIRRSPLRYFDKQNTHVGLMKLLKGESPTRSELTLLEQMFGRELVDAFLSRPRSLRERAVPFVFDLLTIPKTMMSAFDLSFPFRQGFLLGPRNPIEFAAAFKAMFQAFSPEKARQINMELIEEARQFGLIDRGPGRIDLFVPDVEGAAGAVSRLAPREEAFISRFTNKIPGVRLSARTFNTFGNKLKVDVAKKTIRNWQKPDIPGGPVNPIPSEKIDSLNNFLNIFTGRGTLGKLEPIADTLQIGFWSPRLLASRIQAPTQLLDPHVRRLAAENMVASFGLGMTILAIVKTSDIADVELDSRSTDFGQIRIGRTRINFWAGFQPIARYMAQVTVNQQKDRDTGEIRGAQDFPNTSRIERLLNFGRSKISPGIPALIGNELFGRTFIGEELEDKDGKGLRIDKGRLPDPLDQLADHIGINSVREVEALKQVIPLTAVDVVDAIDEYGWRNGSALGALPVFGVGTSTYNIERADVQAQTQQPSPFAIREN